MFGASARLEAEADRCERMVNRLETDPEKILAANRARQEKAIEFDDLFRENSVVRVMSAQIHNLQEDRDRLFKRVQELERVMLDTAERKITEAEALTYGTPLDDKEKGQ